MGKYRKIEVNSAVEDDDEYVLTLNLGLIKRYTKKEVLLRESLDPFIQAKRRFVRVAVASLFMAILTQSYAHGDFQRGVRKLKDWAASHIMGEQHKEEPKTQPTPLRTRKPHGIGSDPDWI
ncbi:MAG: hypothetical protein UT33_C0009G0066 [Candidatus Peregrinibacteria bacterium GW2011_GWC2_39_14]|nr:MAG: hypothetical protein US92_C0005G0066 [Candidatus Peregrinibacteria bacterium GW2011_GWA2_38_36]KKR06615.1 MAG: hypothetical protein UT33_C0009G0066 [Candidatus Peregrinibacteria bacterium GW2011_GWC2_39_14]